MIHWSTFLWRDPTIVKTQKVSYLHAYPIDYSAICKVQLLKDPQELPEACESAVIYSRCYNVLELESNAWLGGIDSFEKLYP